MTVDFFSYMSGCNNRCLCDERFLVLKQKYSTTINTISKVEKYLWTKIKIETGPYGKFLTTTSCMNQRTEILFVKHLKVELIFYYFTKQTNIDYVFVIFTLKFFNYVFSYLRVLYIHYMYDNTLRRYSRTYSELLPFFTSTKNKNIKRFRFLYVPTTKQNKNENENIKKYGLVFPK